MINKIAVIEDDDLIREMIIIHLVRNNFQATGFESAESFQNRVHQEPFDLLILDNILPGITGEDLLISMRETGDNTPILILTVKSGTPDRIRAFNSGADDFLSKPFNLDELLARVQSVIRRSQGARSLPSSRIVIINGFNINLNTRESESNLGRIVLSEKEIRLLQFLYQHSYESLSRADILEEVWGMDVAPSPRTVDNFILRFRKLFEDNPDEPRHFLSIRSQGYRFENKTPV